MTQCVIDPPRRDSAAGWLRPLGGRHRYHPAKGSFARFPSGASLNATMQFTLLPSELGPNLSFSGADCDIHRYTVSRFSFLDLSGVSLNATMQFTLLPVGCDRLRSLTITTLRKDQDGCDRLRSLTITTLRKDLLPDFRRELFLGRRLRYTSFYRFDGFFF